MFNRETPRRRLSAGKHFSVLVMCLAALTWPQQSTHATPSPVPAAKNDKKTDELTLERIFPDRSIFGPSARDMAFSRDGRFCAFLYRAYSERRHGNDLYIHDTQTGQTRRITTATRMSAFQADARKVVEDREAKAKKAGITLADLAAEQLERHGWADKRPSGTWEGQAASEGGPLAAGPCTIEFKPGAKRTIVGEIRLGLVRLPLSAGEISQGRLTAKVEDAALDVKGELSIDFKDGSLSGALRLSSPEQTLNLTLSPKSEPPADDVPPSPTGVLDAWGERLALGDVVLDDDATINDERDGRRPRELAPRYAGIQSFEWSPTGHEMLIISGGDIYRLTLDLDAWDTPLARPGAPTPAPDQPEDDVPPPEAQDADQQESTDAEDNGETRADDQPPPAVEPAAETDAKPAAKAKSPKVQEKPFVPYRGRLSRLTRTRETESDVQYLPDGSGYTYLRGGALLRVRFGSHDIVQLDPELRDGERMVGYRISPDQKRLVFLATRGETTANRARQVTIVNYRDRFARAQQVARHMPDDPWPESYTSIYLFDLSGHLTERGTLERVFTRRETGPRDVMFVPEWSPDSSRVAFAAYEQASDQMLIMEAGFVDKASTDGDKPEQAASRRNNAPDLAEPEDDALDDKADFKIENARVVYRFLHHGGPNTPRMVRPMYLPDSRRIAFISEMSGFRHLHLLDPRYEHVTQLTHGPYEVYPFHLSRDHSTLFAVATKDDPNQEHVFRITLETGEMTRLTTGEGVYSSAAVRDDGSYLLANYVDFGGPVELIAIRTGDEIRPMTRSHPAEAHALTAVRPEYFTYENRHGQTIHGHMFKPSDWTPQDRRPLLIYVYGGPLGERKMATRGSYAAPSYFFARYMTEKHGWVTATIDPRGASGYGAVFEKANFEQVGKPQTEDLVDGARWFVKNHGVDERKLAMHGWSFGGFQTQMVMYTEPDVFAVGIAGAGPTEWHNYNSWYSTGTIGANQPGKTDLEKYSLLPLAKNLKGKLLLVHGVEDSNVLYQDTVRVYRELLKANKEVLVELFIDPTGGHGLGGDVKTIGRYRKYEDFLIRHLGAGTAAEPAPDDPADSSDDPTEEPPAESP
ncbi:MAG: prolyl oligopeptidase family serine peptidase [Phycisphaeraceae bacterium]|nr:prolyl oligopeptidase family serine peptidase [Phycisphaeraceae bacterium]